MTGDAAFFVGLVYQHLQRTRLRTAEIGGRTGHAEDGADFDGLLGGGGAGERERCRKYDPTWQSIHVISPGGGWGYIE